MRARNKQRTEKTQVWKKEREQAETEGSTKLSDS